MDKIIITTPDELKQLITESVQEAFKSGNKNPESNGDASSSAKYLTVSEAARYLKLAKQTVYGFTSSRTIPFIKRAKRLLFTKSELDTWLAQGKKQSIAQMRIELTAPTQKRA